MLHRPCQAIIIPLVVLGVVTSTVDGASLYFNDNGSIKRSNIDGSGVETIYTYGGGPGDLWVRSIDIDPTTNKLYWYAQPPGSNGVIRRSDLDGTNVETLIGSGLSSSIYGLAVDSVNGKMYFHQHKGANSDSSIYTANLDGTGLAKLPLTVYYATDLVPEPLSGKLYFHDNVFYQGIRRSNLDGTLIENLVFGDARGVGLALDLAASKLYYTDAATEQIFRSNLDGSGQELLLSPGHMPRDIELFGGQMYWTNQYGIYRANTDGTGMAQLIPLAGTYFESSNSLVIFAAVPEPTGLALAGVAAPLLLLAELIRRRRLKPVAR